MIRATPRRDVVQDTDPSGVNGVGPERVERFGAEVVAADRTDEDNVGAHPRSSGRLVGALATLMARERAADHRLATRRQQGERHDEVDVDGPDHQDLSAPFDLR